MYRSNIRRTLFLVIYLFAFWVLLDGIVAYSGLLVPEERVRWFSDFYVPDATLGFRIRPNLRNFRLTWMKGEVGGTYSTDSLGFRNVGRDYHSSGYFFIGDSFTFGAWVPRDSTFYGLLERELGEPMITFGVGGYGLAQYDYILRHFCADLRPGSRVFLCVFANDLEPLPDSSFLSDYFERSGWQPYTREAPFVDRFALSRSASSHVARLAARVLFGHGDYATASDGTILYKRRGTSPDYITQRLFSAAEAKLHDMIMYCRAHGFQLTILLFPSKETVYHDEYVRLFNDTMYLPIEAQGYSRLESLAKQQDLSLINLTGLFRQHRDEQLFFARDPHCNERGHRLVADTLLTFLATSTSNHR